jgi:hypothetical protein
MCLTQLIQSETSGNPAFPFPKSNEVKCFRGLAAVGRKTIGRLDDWTQSQTLMRQAIQRARCLLFVAVS